MRFAAASIALLGLLPPALAAVAATHTPSPHHASPTRPDAALRIPGASALAATVSQLRGALRQEAETKDEQQGQSQDGAPPTTLSATSPFLLRLQPRADDPLPTVSTLSIANSFTNAANSSSAAPSATTSAAAAQTFASASSGIVPGVEEAIFTAAGGVYTVTSQSGYAVVDGKTLSVGGAGALIAGEQVTEATGGVVVDGVTAAYVPVTSSSAAAAATSGSSSMATSAAAGSSSAAAGSSGSAAASGSASAASASSGGTAPKATGSANVAAVVVGIVGVLIL